ncbi:KGGVGR-motif variant AAA ATPase [Oxalobacteraceae bacterium A2-2]
MEPIALSLPPLTAHGEVVTFYSYQGGAGRSTALSDIAVLLARQCNASTPVLMVDWDLEAPGLHHHAGQPDGPGVLELFHACSEQLALQRGAGMDGTALAEAVLDAVGWEQYVCRADLASPVYLMRAGRLDHGYGERLAQLRWDQLFNQCPALFRCLAERLARRFRYVLVDARSGRGDSAGICTTLLPGKLVLVFAPGRHGLEGAEQLVRRATAYRASHEDEQRPLLVYPLPSHVEMDDGERRARWRRGDSRLGIEGYQPAFERLLGDCYGLDRISLESYFDEVQLQLARIPAGGEPALRLERGGDRFSLSRSYQALLDWLAGGYFPWQSQREIRLLAAMAEARRAAAPFLVPAVQAGGATLLPQDGALALALARDLAALGELYSGEDRLLPSLQCLEESVALRRRVLGEEHADTLSGKAMLALVLARLGQVEQAQLQQEAVLDVRRRTLGGEHPDTLAATASLAATLGQRGQCEQGLALQDGVLQACRRLLGPDHPQTLAAMETLAELLFLQGGHGQARALQAALAAARERLLGAEHADTLRAKALLARTLAQQAELEGARTLYDTVLQAQCRRLGRDHPDLGPVRERLAELRLQLGEAAAVQEVRQDGAMDDYLRGGAGLQLLSDAPDDDLFLLDDGLPGEEPAPHPGSAPRRRAGAAPGELGD